jgi:hypothetical protein
MGVFTSNFMFYFGLYLHAKTNQYPYGQFLGRFLVLILRVDLIEFQRGDLVIPLSGEAISELCILESWLRKN